MAFRHQQRESFGDIFTGITQLHDAHLELGIVAVSKRLSPTRLASRSPVHGAHGSLFGNTPGEFAVNELSLKTPGRHCNVIWSKFWTSGRSALCCACVDCLSP